MYLIPVLVIVALCLVGVAWSPIFALVFAVPAAIVFFVFVGLSSRADETEPGTAAQQEAEGKGPESGGVWGERST